MTGLLAVLVECINVFTGHGWMTGLLAILVECTNVLQGMAG